MATENTDPIDWTLDEVVEFLCNPERAPWASSSNTPRPDPVTLGAALRENFVTGEVLLNDVDSSTLKDDFGIKALGHRSSVLRAIKWLQVKSDKYQLSQQGHQLEDQPRKNSISLPSYPSPVPITENTVQPDSPGTSNKRRIAPTLMQSKPSRASAHPDFGSPTRPALDSHLPRSPLRIPRQSLRKGTASSQKLDELFYSRLIERYPPGEDEEALPCYGDSGSDGEYDEETWKEIEQNGPPHSTPYLPQQEYESIVAACISEQEARWNREELPIKLHVAPAIWVDSRSEQALSREKKKYSLQLAHLTSRLDTLKQGIIDIEHESRRSLKKACSSLEQTVFQICTEKWKLSVLDQETCPPMVPRPKRAPRKRNRSQGDEDEEVDEESLVSESPASEGSTSDDDSVDIIISDTEIVDRAVEPSKDLPFTLASSPLSDADEPSQPVTKRRRLNEGIDPNGGGVEPLFVEPIDSIDLTCPVNIPEGFQSPGMSHVQDETEGKVDMEIETPPLNPSRVEATDAVEPDVEPLDSTFSVGSNLMQFETSSESGSDTEMKTKTLPPNSVVPITARDDDSGKGMPVKTPPLNPQPVERPASPRPRSRNTPAPSRFPGNQQPPQLPPRGSDDTGWGLDRDAVYEAIFEQVGRLSMKEVEDKRSPLHLLAKSVTCLRTGELRDYPAYLQQWMACTYQDTVHSAITSMMQNKQELGHGEKHMGELGMRLGALFVSWFNCISLTPAGLSKELLRTTLKSIDENPSNFDTFMETFRVLIRIYNKWKQLQPSPPPDSGDNTQPSAVPSGDRQPKAKRRVPTPSERVLQYRAQDRLKKQAKAIEAFKKEREKQGLSNDDPAGQVVAAFRNPVICLPPSIGKYVMPHQLQGIQFMWRELCGADNSQGCLLAHVMGLGKTMQVISLLATISEAAASEDPRIRGQVPRKFHRSQTLVLCTSALVQNWVDEFAIWAPENHHLGQIREISAIPTPNQNLQRLYDIRRWNNEGGVLIVSYDMFRDFIMKKDRYSPAEAKEIEDMLLRKPSIVVGDEAHKLKNEQSAISQTTSRFLTQSRIAMTGSPLANNLIEYYQMLEWIAPGYLGKLEDFKEKYLVPIKAGSYIDSTKEQRRSCVVALRVLNGILNPKIHRADTSVLAQDLPPKTEFVVWVSLTELQKQAYNIFVEEAEKSGINVKLWQWLAIMQLCCNHPHPFAEKLADRTAHLEAEATDSLLVRRTKDAELPSAISRRIDSLFKSVPNLKDPCWSHRAQLLIKILDESKRVGDKVLIFSQSIPTMDYLNDLLETAGRRFARIDGKSGPGSRQIITKDFNTGNDTDILLVSTRAGGLGLNMFGANRVVIFDFLFNPTWEDQAVGRAYRLGQTKPVFVYRFVAGGTFEDNIFNTAVFKSQLAARVVDKKNVRRESTQQIERYLFRVKDVEQKDCSSMLGKDPEVLDTIITDGCLGVLNVTVSRIQNDDNDQLTEVERLHVDYEVGKDRLKRINPHRYALLCQSEQQGFQLTPRPPPSLQDPVNTPGHQLTPRPPPSPQAPVNTSGNQLTHRPPPSMQTPVNTSGRQLTLRPPPSLQDPVNTPGHQLTPRLPPWPQAPANTSGHQLIPMPPPSIQTPVNTSSMADPRHQASPKDPQRRHMGSPDQMTTIPNLNLPNTTTTSASGFVARVEPESAHLLQPSEQMPPPNPTLHPRAFPQPTTRQMSPNPPRLIPPSLRPSHQSIPPLPYISPLLPDPYIPPGSHNTSPPVPQNLALPPTPFDPQPALSGDPLPSPVTRPDSQNTAAESRSPTSTTDVGSAPESMDWNLLWELDENFDLIMTPEDIAAFDEFLAGGMGEEETISRETIDITGASPPMEPDHGASTGQETGQ